ncbi:ATP-dependent nuclease [Roseomonas fluvialis]|uniref:ATP-dependent nuclease n=1 Tax=Roseomonas fluvialis TaxID=1750527 RepID=UPI001FCE20CF|nr:AAA family ATPase [Roseomonas fluvialis]
MVLPNAFGDNLRQLDSASLAIAVGTRMITKISLRNFKKFRENSISFHRNGVSFVAGGNNSGKSTILQALAVWEFCRTVLEMERGKESLVSGYKRQGLGLSDDEFSPVAIASLKHLWTNLKTQHPEAADGYSLSVACCWTNQINEERELEISLALANDRLFIKSSKSNLLLGEAIPTIAYLPPFAGIVSRENLMSGAERRSLIGRGLAGGVIRNLLWDMHQENEKQRALLKIGRTKIKDSDLQKLRQTDPWEQLQVAMATNFNAQLEIGPYNSMYHSNIKVNCIKGEMSSGIFKRFVKYNPRDLMSEGSGFLQWLSVYVLALNPSFGTILLDEPDAHLHPSLQSQLVRQLELIADNNKKQVLMATHSTEILRYVDHSKILHIRPNKISYVQSSDQRTSLFLGLGSEYSPKLDPLRRNKKLLIVEGPGDERLLRIWAAKIGMRWPVDLVVWPWSASHIERKHLFVQLKSEIPALKALSLRDRDDLEINHVNKLTLEDKSVKNSEADLLIRVWRRRHIENYLMCPDAISRALIRYVEDVEQFFQSHAIVIPPNFASRDIPAALADARGKEMIREGANSLYRNFNISPEDIAKEMREDEIADDIKEILAQIASL